VQNSSVFQVYNASAGSGKTFTLVKEYLKVLLQSSDVFYFQKVLAVTFTNKAAGEMKERVLKNLDTFSKGDANDVLELILQETALDLQTIQTRSVKILGAILQNYSAFSITTIDSFTHKIIKSFAYDLGLSLNFEVEMDAVSLLNEAVDVLLSKIGVEKELTNLLISYSISKIDEDKSWDISNELKEFAKVLLNENDIKHFRKLSKIPIADFNKLQESLANGQQAYIKKLKAIGIRGLEIIASMSLEHKDFYYSLLPKHFLALEKDPFTAKFFDQSKLKERIDENLFYSKSKPDDIKTAIESILPELLSLYSESESVFRLLILNQLVLKSIIPLAVLNNINQELNTLKEENNIRLNAEFNQLISDHIKDQPTPFIYERIGQRFMHYCIDEMQDTSVLQWRNLIPLIDNALAQENSSLLLVGDAKQAIYRWRGGKAEQLIELSREESKVFQSTKEVKHLDRNFRSYSEVIKFNNSFFQHVANFFNNEEYKLLFSKGNEQKENKKQGGYVSISFLEKLEDKEEDKIKYPKRVYDTIQNIQDDFLLNEICIIVRKKSEGIAVANYLSEKGIDVISSETLLLNNSKKVRFLVQILHLIQFPNDEETKFEILYFLYQHLKIKDSAHDFLTKYAKNTLQELFEDLKRYEINFSLTDFFQLPFYEKIETLIRDFKLIQESDAYVQFFLDLVLDQQNKGINIQDFLDFWDQKKNTLSIVSSEEGNAVHIMTIHKSKGLEFPVVIFPYDLDIYRQVKPKVWFDKLPDHYSNFSEILVDYSKKIEYINDRGSEIYYQQREELELDNFNLLYVVLTRAVEQLHIITEKRITKTGENTNYYSGIFISFLKKMQLWKDDQLDYAFGKPIRISSKIEKDLSVTEQKNFITTHWQDHNIVLLSSASKLWNTEFEEEVSYGNLLHEILSKIKTSSEVEDVLSFLKNQGDLTQGSYKNIEDIILKIVNHSELKKYFADDVVVFNEKEMISRNKEIMIPDRLVFIHNKVTIIDYKTGKQVDAHQKQINKYAQQLSELNYTIDKKLLVYINDEVLVEEIV